MRLEANEAVRGILRQRHMRPTDDGSNPFLGERYVADPAGVLQEIAVASAGVPLGNPLGAGRAGEEVPAGQADDLAWNQVQEGDRFGPDGGVRTLLEGEDVFPAEVLAA